LFGRADGEEFCSLVALFFPQLQSRRSCVPFGLVFSFGFFSLFFEIDGPLPLEQTVVCPPPPVFPAIRGCPVLLVVEGPPSSANVVFVLIGVSLRPSSHSNYFFPNEYLCATLQTIFGLLTSQFSIDLFSYSFHFANLLPPFPFTPHALFLFFFF